MADYRLYLLDDGGRIMRAVDLRSMDDQAAGEQAQAFPDPRPKEVWQGVRQVWRISRDGQLLSGEL